jgi:hypothetical protein
MSKRKSRLPTPEEGPEIFTISKENGSFKLNRQDFLKLTAAASTAIWISSCVPAQIQKVVEVVATPVPSDTPKPIPTDTPTVTPSPTTTPTLTETPTPTPVIVSAIVNTQGANLRTGPSPDYQAIGPLAYNVPLKVIGKIGDGTWLHVIVKVADLPNLAGAPITRNNSVTEIDGWIKTNLVKVTAGSLDDLPVEAPPPTPTPMPNSPVAPGSQGITYKFTDPYGYSRTYTLPCGSPIPEGAICICNCVAVCSCDGYVAPSPTSCGCDTYGTICTCDVVSYWYPN